MNVYPVKEYSLKLYEAVLRLLPQLDPSIALPSEDYFRKMLVSASITMYVAEAADGQITGMLTLVRYPNITGMKMWIEDVVVDASARGTGAGTALMKAALDNARSFGAAELKLTSRPFREEANRLYLKLGFKRYETNVYKYVF